MAGILFHGVDRKRSIDAHTIGSIPKAFTWNEHETGPIEAGSGAGRRHARCQSGVEHGVPGVQKHLADVFGIIQVRRDRRTVRSISICRANRRGRGCPSCSRASAVTSINQLRWLTVTDRAGWAESEYSAAALTNSQPRNPPSARSSTSVSAIASKVSRGSEPAATCRAVMRSRIRSPRARR